MIERAHPGGIRTWHFSFDSPSLLAAVTTRHGGCSTGPYATLNLATHVGDDAALVQENCRRLGAALGIERLVGADQVHGRDVAVVDGSCTDAGAADVLVTNVPGPVLAIMVADCAPIALYDPMHGAVAAVHAGRNGAVLDSPGAAVAAMVEAYGTDPADIHAGIGPCIGAAHYEIGGDALAEARRVLGADDLLEPTRPGYARFDLPGAVRLRLTQAGVAPERIEFSGVDTFTATDFFSDRAQRPCGRFMLLAGLRLSGG